jgi:hypothetical protein
MEKCFKAVLQLTIGDKKAKIKYQLLRFTTDS